MPRPRRSYTGPTTATTQHELGGLRQRLDAPRLGGPPRRIPEVLSLLYVHHERRLPRQRAVAVRVRQPRPAVVGGEDVRRATVGSRFERVL